MGGSPEKKRNMSANGPRLCAVPGSLKGAGAAWRIAAVVRCARSARATTAGTAARCAKCSAHFAQRLRLIRRGVKRNGV